MSDLKRRLAPLDDVAMPERWTEIRSRAPRAGFDPEPPRPRRAVVIAVALLVSAVSIGWVATAFRNDPEVGPLDPAPPTASPEPSPTPEPEPSPTLDDRAVDLGLGFGLCDARSVRGRFEKETTGRVWFGTRTDDELRCRQNSSRHVAALDVDGDGVAESWTNPIAPTLCNTGCWIVGVSDVDGDGDHEAVLLTEASSTPVFGILDVTPSRSLQPVTFEPGGGPSGWPSSGIARLVIHGDEGYAYAVTCEATPTGPVLTQHSRSSVIDAEHLGTTVRTTTFRLERGSFRVVSDIEETGVQDPPALPPSSRFCDLPLEPLAP